MRKYLLTLFAFLFLVSAWAQERTISGKITAEEDNSEVPGVNVLLKGTTNGVVTDINGDYTIKVPSSGGILVISFVGYSTQEVEIGQRSVVDIRLSSDVKQLTEVVVTAQGIEREQKSLGYAQTTISSKLLEDKPETDVGRALQGRTPGLQILNSSGMAGTSSKINIRGISSITGDTQPLWVVNGVPINTSSNDTNNDDFRDGQVAPSRFLDLDPNNIESVSVLRGLSATVLYGSQGRNGVILVTTKTGADYKGKGSKFQGSVTQSYFVIEAILPEFQNKWANGFDGGYGEFYSNWGPLFDGKAASKNHPYSEWESTFPEHPSFGVHPYVPVAAPNNVKDFFKKGYSSTTSVSLGAQNEFGGINFSYSHLDETGFLKYNDVKRDNFSLGGRAKLTNRLTFNGTFNYVRTNVTSPQAAAGDGSNTFGDGPSVFANIFFTPRNINISQWPWENPVDHSMVYYRNTAGIANPYWVLENGRQTNNTTRFFASTSLSYKISDWLSSTYRLGYDTYSEFQSYYVNKGAKAGLDPAITGGIYRTSGGQNDVIDHSFLLNIDKKISPSISLVGVVGYNLRRNNYSQTGLESLNQVIYGLLEHRNFVTTTSRNWRGGNLNYKKTSAIQGVFVNADLGIKNYLYIGFSARNDWASVLQKANRSLFYPGGSIAFIPTAAFPNMASKTLDFLKFRIAYGSSANFGDPYNTVQTLQLNSKARNDAFGDVTTVGRSLPPYSNTNSLGILANPDLKPELLTETEFGLESELFDRRIKLNASYYLRYSKNQILNRRLDPAVGFGSTTINAGTISNKGVEIALTLTPIRSKSVTWDITANFTKNVSRVESLPKGSKEILIRGFTDLGNFAIEGQPLNVIKGTYSLTYLGKPIVTGDGNYASSSNIGVIGDPNPKWLGSLITSVSFKGFTFSTQWDYVAGGQMFSYTAATMMGRGVAKDLESFNILLPLILPGVVVGAEGEPKENVKPISTAGVFFDNSIVGGAAPNDRGIYDATRVRFREISLSYKLPQSLVSKLKLTSVSITAIGSNLWFRAINAPKYAKADFDRTAFGANNGAGFDYLGGPSARRYGVNLKINF